MAKVNGEVMYKPLHVGPLAIPLRQAMDRKAVPKIVQSRLMAGPVGASNTNVLSQSLESRVQNTGANGRPLSGDEEKPPVPGRQMSSRPPTGSRYNLYSAVVTMISAERAVRGAASVGISRLIDLKYGLSSC